MQRGIECVATMLVERPKVPKEAAEDHLKDRKKSKNIYMYLAKKACLDNHAIEVNIMMNRQTQGDHT